MTACVNQFIVRLNTRKLLSSFCADIKLYADKLQWQIEPRPATGCFFLLLEQVHIELALEGRSVKCSAVDLDKKMALRLNCF